MKKILLLTIALLVVLGGNTILQAAESSTGALTDVDGMSFEKKDDLLFDAINSDDPEKVKYLLGVGARVNTQSIHNDMKTPLYVAVEKNNSNIVRILLSQGALIHIYNRFGETPFYLSVDRGFTEIAQNLIAAGASVDSTDQYGRPPLYVAASNGNIELVKILLAAGASLDVTNCKGSTPLSIAVNKRHTEIERLLRERLKK